MNIEGSMHRPAGEREWEERVARFDLHPPEAAVALLERLQQAVAGCCDEGGTQTLELAPLDEAERRFIHQTLGEGEVSARLALPAAVVQESIFPGVWRVRYTDGASSSEYLEAAPFPRLLREKAFEGAARHLSLDPAATPPEVGNAVPILAELAARSAAYRGGPAQVINLTLLPFFPADHAYLDRLLGSGPVSILSRGYGRCQITATGLANVWRVSHFNVSGTLILDTLEVVDLPAAAVATEEDIRDSAARLAELCRELK